MDGASSGTQSVKAPTFKENLANHYLEALSRLNNALNDVVDAATAADERRTQSEEQTIATWLATYNVDAAAGVNSLTSLNNAKTTAVAEQTAASDTELQSQQQAIRNIDGAFEQAAKKYAAAARRQQIKSQALQGYIATVFQGIANDFNAAKNTVDTLAAQEETQRQQYSTLNGQYVDALNRLGSNYTRYQVANDEYEKRLAIEEYATTPYLFSVGESTGGDLTEWAENATDEYERAYQMLQLANENLKNAGAQVLMQDNLADFNAIVTGLEGGTTYPPLAPTERDRLAELREKKFYESETLLPGEEAELTQLTHREMYERYGDLIQARAEYIKHTMRMVRIQKADQIIQTEIAKKRAEVQEKERAFNEAVAAKFGGGDVQARNAVYQRLATQWQGGARNFAAEFTGWFWGAGAWASTYGNAAVAAAAGGTFAITPSQIIAAQGGVLAAASIPEGDRQAIVAWMGSGGGLAEYGTFTAGYSGYMMALMNQDLMMIQMLVTTIAQVTNIALFAATAAAAYATGSIMIAGVFTIPLAPPWYVTAVAATGMVLSAVAQIMAAQLTFAMSVVMSTVMLALTLIAGNMSGMDEIISKQQEFESAQAELNYFTRNDSVDTLKERLKAYGAMRGDDGAQVGEPDVASQLYLLTDDDLKYLIENGNTSGLTTEEASESLDLTAHRDNVQYRDGFGRRYNPATITYSQPGPLVGGIYGDNYTQIKVLQNNGSMATAWAKIIAEGAAEHAVLDMGKVLQMTVTHGNNLRENRALRYETEGSNIASATGDAGFILRERDQTYDGVYADATARVDGGREYRGYAMAGDDYIRNQSDIYEQELQQRLAVQLKEWELREQELNDRYNAWEKKMATILARGQKSWSQAENKYLAQWRQWERDFDADKKTAEGQWDARIQDHFAKKEQWETDLRQKANAGQIEQVLGDAVDSLNAQMSQLSASGIEMPERNRLEAVNKALAELQLREPSNTERFQNVNKSIATFNTTIAVANLAKTDFSGVETLAANFRETMREQERNMRVQRNVALYEQYNDLIEDFKRQIEQQNRAVENATRVAAVQAGLFEMGDLYVKQGSVSGFLGVVNKYQWFDTEAALDAAMATSTGGLDFKKGPDLVKFLEEKDQVEVDAYFEVQTTALQSIFKKIAGKGTPDQRQGSRDAAIVGQLGMWIGEAPGQDDNFQSAQQIAGHYQPDLLSNNAGAVQLMNFGAFGGFGELGSFGARPGGAPFGFYVQLDFISKASGKADSAKFRASQDIGTIGAGLTAAAGVLSLGGGVAFMAATKFNSSVVGGYQAGAIARSQGRDGGTEERAGLIDGLKNAAVTAAGGLAGAGLEGALAAAGITAALAPLNRNPKTGKYEYSMSDAAGLQIGISALGAAAAGAGAAAEAATKASDAARVAGKVTSESARLAQSAQTLQQVAAMASYARLGMQAANSAMRYDADGTSRGISTDAWLENNFSSPDKWITGAAGLAMGIKDALADAPLNENSSNSGDSKQLPLKAQLAQLGGALAEAARRRELGLGDIVSGALSFISSPFETTGQLAGKLSNFFSPDHNGNRWMWETTAERQQRASLEQSFGVISEQLDAIADRGSQSRSPNRGAYDGVAVLLNSGKIQPGAEGQQAYAEIRSELDRLQQERGSVSQADVAMILAEKYGIDPRTIDWNAADGRTQSLIQRDTQRMDRSGSAAGEITWETVLAQRAALTQQVRTEFSQRYRGRTSEPYIQAEVRRRMEATLGKAITDSYFNNQSSIAAEAESKGLWQQTLEWGSGTVDGGLMLSELLGKVNPIFAPGALAAKGLRNAGLVEALEAMTGADTNRGADLREYVERLAALRNDPGATAALVSLYGQNYEDGMMQGVIMQIAAESLTGAGLSRAGSAVANRVMPRVLGGLRFNFTDIAASGIDDAAEVLARQGFGRTWAGTFGDDVARVADGGEYFRTIVGAATGATDGNRSVVSLMKQFMGMRQTKWQRAAFNKMNWVDDTVQIVRPKEVTRGVEFPGGGLFFRDPMHRPTLLVDSTHDTVAQSEILAHELIHFLDDQRGALKHIERWKAGEIDDTTLDLLHTAAEYSAYRQSLRFAEVNNLTDGLHGPLLREGLHRDEQYGELIDFITTRHGFRKVEPDLKRVIHEDYLKMIETEWWAR